MSSQKIPNVGRVDVSVIRHYSITKTGLLCRDGNNAIICHIPCDATKQDRLMELLYEARHSNSKQIDFSFLTD